MPGKHMPEHLLEGISSLDSAAMSQSSVGSEGEDTGTQRALRKTPRQEGLNLPLWRLCSSHRTPLPL